MLKFKLNDLDYYIELPVGYTDPGRVIWKANFPGIYAKNPRGKQCWLRLKRGNYGKKSS